MKITVFRHMLPTGLHAMESALSKQGLSYDYVDTFYEDLSGFDPLSDDVLIVLGGSPGAYQTDAYPFLSDVIKILEKRLRADKPVFGICLGAQLMARALGADVYAGEKGLELGWKRLQLTEEGRHSPMKHFDGAIAPIFSWHGDTFDLPEGATLLASTEQYKHQAYAYGKSIAVQFHPEVNEKAVHEWLVRSAASIKSGLIDPVPLREDTARHAKTMEHQTEKFLKDWIVSL